MRRTFQWKKWNESGGYAFALVDKPYIVNFELLKLKATVDIESMSWRISIGEDADVPVLFYYC